jgi:uncharacterized protein YndB with AHSA1/START domain
MADISHVIRVTHRFEAAPERVFDAWVTPETIAVWMAAPALKMMGTQDEMLRIEADARVGGRFSFMVRRQGQELDHVGEYLEVDRPRRLVFTWGVVGWPGSSTVSLDLVPDGTGTLLTLTATGVAPEYQARTEQGWTAILEGVATSV